MRFSLTLEISKKYITTRSVVMCSKINNFSILKYFSCTAIWWKRVFENNYFIIILYILLKNLLLHHTGASRDRF